MSSAKTTACVTTVTRRFVGIHNDVVGEKLLHVVHQQDQFCVGDQVVIEQTSGSLEITEVQKRTNLLLRQHFARRKLLCANVDHLFILSGPDNLLQREFIDRLICAAFEQEIPCTLIANKMDLQPGYHEALSLYRQIDIAVIPISAKTGAGVEELDKVFEQTKGRVVTLTGISGVGKSTLLNRLFEKEVQTTSSVSQKSGQGRQTTSQSRALYHKGLNLYVVDLPGVQQFGLHHISASDILASFREFDAYQCEFDNCSHIGEHNCAVKEAVSQNEIPESRYQSYVKFMKEHKRFSSQY